MAIALQPDVVTQGEDHHVEIALHGAARGATLVDWDDRSGKPANARIVMDLDQARFEALAASALGAA